MPLYKGKGSFDKNMGILLSEWKRTGKIGNIKIKTERKARSVAAAISYRKERER